MGLGGNAGFMPGTSRGRTYHTHTRTHIRTPARTHTHIYTYINTSARARRGRKKKETMLYCWREKGWESNGFLIALVRRQSALGFYRKKETVSSLNLAQKRQRHRQRGIESVLGFNRVCVCEGGGGGRDRDRHRYKQRVTSWILT